MKLVTLALAFAALGFAAAARQDNATPAPAIAPAEIERLAVAIERALPVDRRLEGLVTSRIWMTKPGEAPPNPSRDPPGLQMEYLVRLLGAGHAVVGQRPLYGMHVILDGRTYQVNYHEGQSSVSEGTRDPSAGGLALLLQTSMFSPVELEGSLADAVRAGTPESLTVHDDVAVLRFTDKRDVDGIAAYLERMKKEGKAIDGPAPKPWPREITVDLSDPPRVLGWAVDVPVNGAGKPSVRNEWAVEQWQEVDGLRLPQRIRRTTELRGGRPYVQVVELSRLTRLPAPAPDDVAALHPLPEGLRIEDEGRRFQFTIGSPSITFEARALRLQAPLWMHPGKRLEELINAATPE